MTIRPKTRRWLLVLIAACVLTVSWVTVNRPGRFGLCRFGFTVYSCRPFIVSDVQIRADGASRTVDKSHDLQMETLSWLLTPEPEILIIGTGWEGATEVARAVRELPGVDVRILKSGAARDLYNRFRRTGKRVAIHYHATC